MIDSDGREADKMEMTVDLVAAAKVHSPRQRSQHRALGFSPAPLVLHRFSTKRVRGGRCTLRFFEEWQLSPTFPRESTPIALPGYPRRPFFPGLMRWWEPTEQAGLIENCSGPFHSLRDQRSTIMHTLPECC